MWTAAFWKATAERVIGTFGATLLAALGVDSGVNLADADWPTVLTLAGTAAGVTLVKCLVANGTSKSGPGFTQAEQVTPKG